MSAGGQFGPLAMDIERLCYTGLPAADERFQSVIRRQAVGQFANEFFNAYLTTRGFFLKPCNCFL